MTYLPGNNLTGRDSAMFNLPVSPSVAVKYHEDSTNETTILINDIRKAFAEYPTLGESITMEDDPSIDKRLRVFTDHIQSKLEEITANASVLLGEFELYSASPESDSLSSFGSLDDLEKLDNFTRMVDIDASLGFNVSLNVNSWLHDVEEEVAVIEAWEVEAENLANVANAAFQSLKSDVTKEIATKEARSALTTNAQALHRNLQSDREELERQMTQSKWNEVRDKLLSRDDMWESGGFHVEGEISPETALKVIKSIPLKTYKLRDDKHRDLGVKKNERRTRHHVGVVDGAKDGNGAMEPSSIFSYNIGAVSQLATMHDRLASASLSFFELQSTVGDKLSTLTTRTKSRVDFKSPKQLASDVAALDTEAALTRIARLSQTILQSTRINSIYSRYVSQVQSLAKRDALAARENNAVQESTSARELYAESAEAYLDQLLIYFDVMDKMNALKESTKRELVEMNEEAAIEGKVAKEEIVAEAAVERENEATSLEHIKLLGKARMDEVIDAIESTFWHLTGCFQHIITPEGRQQFLFYICASAAFVFLVTTTKEMITLAGICILRFFTSPRLVREYGNLAWTSCNRANRPVNRAKVMQHIVLTSEVKQRMDVIVKIASEASKRRFPLRSVLIHGKPGTGKSIFAKAIAQCTGLPYALMSGGDVMPLGSQGPAELRRLLAWASSNRRGGIIVIDEAESALGSRAASSSLASGFSRDCLNVLLSLTGNNFSNIMLILTTTNPAALDEAVLDRMDEMIELQLPPLSSRKMLIRNSFNRQFEVHRDRESSFLENLLSTFRRSANKARVDANFDVEHYLSDLSSKTDDFSGREIHKIIQGIVHKTHASDAGVLDETLWVQESAELVSGVLKKKEMSRTERVSGKPPQAQAEAEGA